jgi:hypothetical protein
MRGARARSISTAVVRYERPFAKGRQLWTPRSVGVIVTLLVLNLAANLVALGWLAWISARPTYWFPG